MGFITIWFVFTIILFIANVESQRLLSGQGLQGVDNLPVIGACDRIASRGVTNCMQNFLPTSLLSGLSSGQSDSGVCCNYRKYNACINGLHNGLRVAMEAKKCPKSYSTRIIKSLGDSLIGLPIKTLCQSSEGTKCGRTTNKKKKKKPSRGTVASDESPSVLQSFIPSGLGSGGSRSPIDGASSFFEPIAGIFGRPKKPSRRTSSNESPSVLGSFLPTGNSGRSGSPIDEASSVFEPILKPVRDTFSGPKKPSRRTSNEDSSSFLESILPRGRGNSGGSGRRPIDEASSVFEPILKPVRDTFSGPKKPSRRTSNEDSSSVLESLLPRGRGNSGGTGRSPIDEASSVIEHVRGLFGGNKKSSKRTSGDESQPSILEPVSDLLGGFGK